MTTTCLWRFIDGSQFATGQGLECSSQLSIFNAGGCLDVCEAHLHSIIEEHENDCLRTQKVTASAGRKHVHLVECFAWFVATATRNLKLISANLYMSR